MRALLLSGVAALFLPVVLVADDTVPLDKVPAKVTDAVKAKFPNAKMLSCKKDKADGVDVFEVAVDTGSGKFNVLVTPEGRVARIEKEVPLTALPKAVTDTLDSKYAKATRKSALELSKGDKVYAYEVTLVTPDKKTWEVTVDLKGKITDVEEVKD